MRQDHVCNTFLNGQVFRSYLAKEDKDDNIDDRAPGRLHSSRVFRSKLESRIKNKRPAWTSSQRTFLTTIWCHQWQSSKRRLLSVGSGGCNYHLETDNCPAWSLWSVDCHCEVQWRRKQTQKSGFSKLILESGTCSQFCVKWLMMPAVAA